jgi:hypothetical protein
MRRTIIVVLFLVWLLLPSIINNAVILANDPLFPLGLYNVLIEDSLDLLLVPLAFPVVIAENALVVSLYYAVSIALFVIYRKKRTFH